MAGIGRPPRVTIVPSVVTDSIVDSVPDWEADSRAPSVAPPPEVSAATGSDDLQSTVDPDTDATQKAEIARLKDQLLRTLADFDNFRKRSRREISEAERIARDELLRELLPVFDNLERASQHAVGSSDIQSLADGIQMVMRQFLETLAKLGVERVVTVGQPFDPAVHEAVQQVDSADLPPGSVAQELLAGYHVGDRLIRPAMVVVARPVST